MKIIKFIFLLTTTTISGSKANEFCEEALSIYSKRNTQYIEKRTDNKTQVFINPAKILNLRGIFQFLCVSQLNKLETHAYGYFQSKNLTNNVWDHLMCSNYKIALGCPTEKEIENYLPNGLYAPWLPCQSLNNSEDCYSIRPFIESHYNTVVETSGNYDIGYNMGYAYETLQKKNKLKCTINDASKWKDLNLQRLYQLVGTYGQNIRMLKLEKESVYSWRMNSIVNEMINKIQNSSDQKKIKNYLINTIKNKNKYISYLNDSSYQPHISLNVLSDPIDAIKKLARAFKQNLTITNMVVASVTDSELITLVDGFQYAESLDTLYISCLENTEKSIFAIVKMLSNNKSLKFFDLSWAQLTDSAIVDIAKALSHNRVLQRFMLSSSNITEYHIQILKDGLSKNKRLKIISSQSGPAGSIRIEMPNPATI